MPTPRPETRPPGRKPNFDHLALPYRWMELLTFGPFLMRTRTTFLDRLAGCRRALVLGDGDGRFVARLLEVNPDVIVDAVDVSEAMLATLLNRCGRNASRVTPHNADARSWQPPAQRSLEPYDLVVTHFFLDCLTQPQVQSLAARLRGAVTPGVRWIVSEFAVPAGLYGRLVARPLVGSLYWAFSLLTGLEVRSLPDHVSALRAAGFRLEAERNRLRGTLIAELWSLDRARDLSP